MGRFSLVKSDKDYKLSEEAAHAEVMALIDYYQIDLDAIPERKDRQAIEAAITKLVEYYRRGLLENSKEGSALKVRQHLQQPPGETRDLTWEKMTAKAKLATDGYDIDDRYARVYALIAHLTGLPPEAVHRLERIDLATAEALGLLFLLG